MKNKTIPISFRKWIKLNFGDKSDLIDVDAYYDLSLQISENKSAFREQFNALMVVDVAEKVAEFKAHEEALRDKKELELRREEKKVYEQILKGEIKGADLNGRFSFIKENIKMVARGFLNGLVLLGEAGIGKTHLVLKTLQEENLKDKTTYFSGKITPIMLYKFLYENSDKIIILDDIYLTDDIIPLLQNATWEANGKRTLFYSSFVSVRFLEKWNIPNCFEFTGRLIILTNISKIKNDEAYKSLLTRVPFFEVNLSFEEKKAHLSSVAEATHNDLTLEERKAVLTELFKLITPATKNISLRLLLMSYKYYLFAERNLSRMSELIKEIVITDEEAEMILKQIQEEKHISECLEEWYTEFGKSRASYFRKKKELLKKSHSLN